LGVGDVGDALSGDGPPARGAAPRSVILEPAAYRVGRIHAETDLVEFHDRQVIDVAPGLRTVTALVDPSVGPHEQPIGIGFIDDESVHVPVRQRGSVRPESLSAVVGDVQTETEDVEAALVLGIDDDLAEIERTRRERIDARPVLAPVGAPEHTAGLAKPLVERHRPGLVRFDHGVQVARLRRNEGEADAAGLLRDPLRHAPEGLPAIGRLVNTPLVAEAAALEAPGLPAARIHGGVDDLRVRRIEEDVYTARVLVDLQRRAPALAAVA